MSMNRRGFFQTIAGVVAGLCGAGAPGKAKGVCSKPVDTRTMNDLPKEQRERVVYARLVNTRADVKANEYDYEIFLEDENGNRIPYWYPATMTIGEVHESP